MKKAEAHFKLSLSPIFGPLSSSVVDLPTVLYGVDAAAALSLSRPLPPEVQTSPTRLLHPHSLSLSLLWSFLAEEGLCWPSGMLILLMSAIKPVEKNKPEIDHLRFWCQYWILVAVLTVCERIGDAFISWVPMYSEAKLAFFIYLWYPKTKGTTYVYDSFFRPYVSKHENDIDRNLLELRTRAGDIAVLYCQRAVSYGQTRVLDVLQYIASQSTPNPRPSPPLADHHRPLRFLQSPRNHLPLLPVHLQARTKKKLWKPVHPKQLCLPSPQQHLKQLPPPQPQLRLKQLPPPQPQQRQKQFHPPQPQQRQKQFHLPQPQQPLEQLPLP
ncbi:hypothetical protein MLD38_012865 [Melastoma candidum]|uniref:Uncharacterized protein n=1 Tax=Melastoma candidum TaxID=119954 RepID=A0ACB9R8A6_9MYRT|nr:hypothetical protein MLD38_012865 [Melastoma candidum]